MKVKTCSLPHRILSAALAALIFATSVPPVVWASTAAAVPAPASSVSAPETATRAASQTPARPASRLPVTQTAFKMAPDFSSEPQDQEFTAVRGLEQPLMPVGKTTVAENQLLAQAITRYVQRTNPADQSSLTGFLDRFPNSSWRPALLVNMGVTWRQTGHFTKALNGWLEAWNATKNQTNAAPKSIADRAFAEYVQMNAWVGRYQVIEPLLNEVASRQFSPTAAAIVTGVSEALWFMKNQPDKSFSCGPFAIKAILTQTKASANPAAVMEAKPTGHGFSLSEVAALAEKHGLKYRMAKRSPGTPIPVNSVVHWKLNHYGAIMQEKDGRYLIQDSTFASRYGEQLWVNRIALEEESSGYFLIPESALGKGWTEIMPEEGQKVWGRGITGGRPPCTSCDPKSCNNCDARKMPQSSVHLMAVSVNIVDIPVWHDPPKGPAVNFRVTYNQTEGSPNKMLDYGNMGPNWTHDFFSYIQEGASNNRDTVTRYTPGGGYIIHDGYVAGTGEYPIDRHGGILKYYTSPERYELSFGDGSKLVYAQKEVLAGGNRLHLTKQIDPAGNEVVIAYDSSARITHVNDALGQSTILHYEHSDPKKISSVEEPFGRKAYFEYDSSGRLSSIKDMGNLVSSFAYDNPYNASGIASMTTPYGTTTFLTWQDLGQYKRTLLVTDPNGDREFFVSDHDAYGVAFDSQQTPDYAATGKYFETSLLMYRNTFHFGKKAMSGVVGDPVDYSQATIYHWLHGREGGDVVTSPLLESMQRPGQSRVFFWYPGQNDNTRDDGITFGQPSMVAQVVEDASSPTGYSTKVQQYEYNAVGNVTKYTDPLGRVTEIDYYAGGQNVQKVRRLVTTPGSTGIVLSGGGLRLEEEGPLGGTVPPNLASQSGSTAFAIDSLSGYPIHDLSHLNDGAYGNANSWIGNSGNPAYAGIKFDGQYTIGSFAFGRDNLGTYTDRTLGTYTLQYTRVASPGTGTTYTGAADTGWETIGTLNYQSAGTGLFTAPSRRHQFTFTPVEATGIRLLVPGSGLSNGTCVDELEVNPPDIAVSEVLGEFGTYNGQNRPVSYTDAARQTYNFQWNSAGQLTQVTNPKSEVTRLVHDAGGEGYLQSIQQDWAGGTKTTSVTYDGYKRLRTVTSSDNYTLTYDYDDLDRVTKVTYPDLRFEQYQYDRLDVVTAWDREGHRTHMTYDNAGRLLTVKDRLNRVTSFGWCGCGSLDSMTDPMGRMTTWVRDVSGRVTDKIYDDAKTTYYEYEAFSGRLKSITDAKSQVKNYSYNLDGTLKGITYENEQIATPNVSLTYDPGRRRLVSITDGTGTTQFGYRPITATATLGAGRLASVDGPLANDTITFGYDQLGRVLSRVINGASDSVTFDTLGRLATHVSHIGTFTPGYVGDTHRLASVAYPSGQTTAFDYFTGTSDFRLKQIWHKKSGGATLSKFDYTYDAAGRILEWSQQADAATPQVFTFDYDAEDQLLNAVLKPQGGNPTKAFGYRYDDMGNRLTEQQDVFTPSQTSTITSGVFNGVNQLTGQNPSGNVPVQFKGKVNEAATVTVNGQNAQVMPDQTSATGGRIFSATVSLPTGNNTVTVTAEDFGAGSGPHHGGNETSQDYSLTVAAGAARTFTYDDNGNCTAKGNVTYEWDAEDRLVAINNGTLRSEFTYDGFGRRVKIVEKNNGSVTSTKQFLWVGTQIAEERDGNNQVQARFCAEGYIRYTPDASPRYYTRDHLGNVREVTDSGGNVRARYDYDPYGRVTKVSGNVDSDFLYTGHYYHAPSGLHLALYRAYDADLGRWLNRDPIEEEGGVNLYGYVGNDPENKTDPFGLEKWPTEICLSIARVMGMAAARVAAARAAGKVDSDAEMTFLRYSILFETHCRDDDDGGDDEPPSGPRVPVPVKGLDRCPRPVPVLNRSFDPFNPYPGLNRRYRTPFSHAAPGLAVAAGAGLAAAAAAASVAARRPIIP